MTKRPELHVVDVETPERSELSAASDAVRAVSGGALDRVDHEALLALALGDEVVDGVVLDEERAEAEVLRRALEGDGDHDLAELATALRLAARPTALDALTNERLLRRARVGSERRTLQRIGWPLASAVAAMAAGVAVWLTSTADAPRARATAAAAGIEAVEPRSTAGLFDAASPFPVRGGESDRLGRIVASRASDLRANRFAKWGVR